MPHVYLIKEGEEKQAQVLVPDIIGMCIVKIAKITAKKTERELERFTEEQKRRGTIQQNIPAPQVNFYIYGDTFLPPTKKSVDFCARVSSELLMLYLSGKIKPSSDTKTPGEIIAEVSDIFFLSIRMSEEPERKKEKDGDDKSGKETKNTSVLTEIDESERPDKVDRRFQAVVEDEIFRIKDGWDYERAVKILQDLKNSEVMKKAFVMSPETTYISLDTEIEEGVLIYPDAVLISSFIGSGSIIGKGAFILHSRIGPNTKVMPYSYLEEVEVEGESQIGPFARTRPNVLIRKGAKIGNFVELKNSEIGEGSKAQHFSYIGDAKIGRNVNIGAGTVTCNYDGEKKSQTEIHDNAFIGSGSMLVAPIKVGEWGYTAAGSTITKDVPEGALAIERAELKFIHRWGEKKLKKKKKK